jgi:hypothetical protein
MNVRATESDAKFMSKDVHSELRALLAPSQQVLFTRSGNLWSQTYADFMAQAGASLSSAEFELNYDFLMKCESSVVVHEAFIPPLATPPRSLAFFSAQTNFVLRIQTLSVI